MSPPPDIHARRAQYRATVDALEKVHAQELAAMTDERAVQILLTLKCAQRPYRERPDWSGLVEQQAIFHRRRNKA